MLKNHKWSVLLTSLLILLPMVFGLVFWNELPVFNKIFGMNKRKLGVIVIVLFVFILILFPFIDTNFFYANRIKNRINILH